MATSKVVKIALLSRPNKRSGVELKPGQSSKQMGGRALITNLGATSFWVDRQTPKKKKK